MCTILTIILISHMSKHINFIIIICQMSKHINCSTFNTQIWTQQLPPGVTFWQVDTGQIKTKNMGNMMIDMTVMIVMMRILLLVTFSAKGCWGLIRASRWSRRPGFLVFWWKCRWFGHDLIIYCQYWPKLNVYAFFVKIKIYNFAFFLEIFSPRWPSIPDWGSRATASPR